MTLSVSFDMAGSKATGLYDETSPAGFPAFNTGVTVDSFHESGHIPEVMVRLIKCTRGNARGPHANL